MKTFVYTDGDQPFVLECTILAHHFGDVVIDRHQADVAIAPCLRRRLVEEEWTAPRFGTLIFHPSALPYRRGPDAIKHTIAAGERVSAATWFWCNGDLDEGDICAWETVVLAPGESPREAYRRRFIPAALIALRRALLTVNFGIPLCVPQDPALATYDGPFER